MLRDILVASVAVFAAAAVKLPLGSAPKKHSRKQYDWFGRTSEEWGDPRFSSRVRANLSRLNGAK